ncbi:UNVERIFIED_ORG: FUSC family protein [Clostridium botulinum]|uniref:FUSC family protein n=1 Tax=Clostridium botulinum TaxID=1491 RepID=A0A6B4RUI0_CLOBO|nr:MULTISPECIES: FUSC family protein [Clostridium]MBN1035126.1 FUSC family protein [Clostridium botulinum]MBY6809126.1 FUSC family protein [Clostridium botulinum]MBY6822169.1 FUSC family protein [Clostridium botulinum]MBY6833041.1 FUSC family protein [Clostridium botulinum]MBY6929931.1 FUSC family protein [Clostridium botulinum]
MKFYDAMQLGACNLKPLIKETTDEKLKKKYKVALIVKTFLCVLFCMILVTAFSKVFGVENSIVGVVTVIALMTFRFSNLNFKTSQSAFTILGIFLVFIISPYISSIVNPMFGFVVNLISMMIIVILSCHNVVLSNQSTLILSYLLLYGYEVNDFNGYINRVIALIVGGIIVAGIFYYKHRKVSFNNTIKDIIKDIDLNTKRTKWQIKLVLGISSAILLGELINLPRVMWIGFSVMSIIQPDIEKFEFRIKSRYPYVIIGCLMFGVVNIVLPQEFRGYIGMLGGIMVGLSATYKWQTSFNCFGALAAAIPTFGLGGAIIIRIVNNILGALYSIIFNKIFDNIDEKISGKFNKDIISQA